MEAAPAKVHQVKVSQYDELIPYNPFHWLETLAQYETRWSNNDHKNNILIYIYI